MDRQLDDWIAVHTERPRPFRGPIRPGETPSHDDARFPELPGCGLLMRALIIGDEPHDLRDHQDPAVHTRRVDHRVRVPQRERDRSLAEDMLPLGQGRDDQRTMKATRRGHVDGVDRFVSQDLLRVREPWRMDSLRESASLRCRTTHDPRDFNAVPFSECRVRGCMGRAHSACAHDCESQPDPGGSQVLEAIRTTAGCLKVTGVESGFSRSRSPRWRVEVRHAFTQLSKVVQRRSVRRAVEKRVGLSQDSSSPGTWTQETCCNALACGGSSSVTRSRPTGRRTTTRASWNTKVCGTWVSPPCSSTGSSWILCGNFSVPTAWSTSFPRP